MTRLGDSGRPFGPPIIRECRFNLPEPVPPTPPNRNSYPYVPMTNEQQWELVQQQCREYRKFHLEQIRLD